MTTTAAQKVLLKDRDALIAAHDAQTGTDQSSIAKRAGKVRSIRAIDSAMLSPQTSP